MPDRARRVGRIRRAGLDAESGIGVDQRAAGELLETRSVPGVVLPVTVAAQDVEVLVEKAVSAEPVEELAAFVPEAADVAVVVPFAFAVGAD